MTHSGPTQNIYPKKSAHTNEIVCEIKLSYERETMNGRKAAASLNLFSNYQ